MATATAKLTNEGADKLKQAIGTPIREALKNGINDLNAEDVGLEVDQWTGPKASILGKLNIKENETGYIPNDELFEFDISKMDTFLQAKMAGGGSSRVRGGSLIQVHLGGKEPKTLTDIVRSSLSKSESESKSKSGSAASKRTTTTKSSVRHK